MRALLLLAFLPLSALAQGVQGPPPAIGGVASSPAPNGGTIPPSALTPAPADTVLGNPTSSTAPPVYTTNPIVGTLQVGTGLSNTPSLMVGGALEGLWSSPGVSLSAVVNGADALTLSGGSATFFRNGGGPNIVGKRTDATISTNGAILATLLGQGNDQAGVLTSWGSLNISTLLGTSSCAGAGCSGQVQIRVTTNGAAPATLFTVAGGASPAITIGGSAMFVAANMSAAIASFSGIVTTQSGTVHKTRIITAAGAITVATTDEYVLVNKTVGAASAVSLPGASTAGTRFCTKDMKGDANTNNITVTPTSGTIDGAANDVINTAHGAMCAVSDGTNYQIESSNSGLL